jgi:hypothetical protein
MGIEFTAQFHIKASGSDERIDDVQVYALIVLQRCLDSTKPVPCHESARDHRLGAFDFFRLIKFFSTNMPWGLRVAVVCRPEVLSDTEFIENVVLNRGHCL